ncbi:hypothetical protein TNCT_115511 [Trichonephila clavata]|uniref:Uncharacterized protein n=1 Tax=Trichonephila clavata TaxID=2740835 RepID=A0A8X6KH93_TRICU|nr:hypothetical protein TNCT_115511 [Trichonephila clavata]
MFPRPTTFPFIRATFRRSQNQLKLIHGVAQMASNQNSTSPPLHPLVEGDIKGEFSVQRKGRHGPNRGDKMTLVCVCGYCLTPTIPDSDQRRKRRQMMALLFGPNPYLSSEKNVSGSD